jgi:general secretion pathway protein K
MRREREEDELGFALIVVISVLAVLALLAAGFAVATRQETDIVRNTMATSRARALADAGVSLAEAGLVSRDAATRWHPDGRPYAVTVGGGEIHVSVQDETGKVDLNWTPIPVVEGLVGVLGLDPEAGAAIVAGIAGRRGAVRLPAVPPGEVPGSNFAGGPTLRDLAAAPFRSADELLTLPGVTRDAFEQLRPFVTVYAQSAHINSATAPRSVLLAVPGLTPAEADLVIASRTPHPDGSAAGPLPDLGAAKRFLAFAELRAATITAEATGGADVRFVRRAVVATTTDPYHPFRILEWRQEPGVASSPAVLASGAAGP